ncbi:unnamed protein product [Spodoptera exigua]|nr:unnamed protein product [Spodoptera exigua]
MPAKECPSCGNDKNATYGCGVNCGRRCSNYMLSNVICADVCYTNGCDCKKDYVFDDYLGFCVLPQDCKTTTESKTDSSSITESNEKAVSTTEKSEMTTKGSDKIVIQSALVGIESGGGSDSTTEQSHMTTESGSTTEEIEMGKTTTSESGKESTTEKMATLMTTAVESENGLTTEDETGISMTTEKSPNGSTTKVMESGTTIAAKSGKESTTEGMATVMTTAAESENGSTTEDETGMSMTTEKSENGSTTKGMESGTTIAAESGKGSTTEAETNITTEKSLNGSTTKAETDMTTEKSENGSTTKAETDMTTEKSVNGLTTKAETDMTTEKSENGSTTEEAKSNITTDDSKNGEATEHYLSNQSTTTKGPISTTTMITLKPITTTKIPLTTTTSVPETTMKTTTHTPSTTKAPITTTKSVTTQTTPTTEASTTKGPKDCKGRNEWYYDCAPSCPQRTCEDYLNGVRCQASDRTTGCKPECRCLVGYFKDAEGKCVSRLECRKSSSSTGMISTTTISTTEEPTCEEQAIPLFAVGSLGYTLKLLYEISLSNPGHSVMVGGASVLYLMGQLALYAKGKAKTELLNVFNLKDTEQISCAFPKISAALTMEYSDIEFSLFCKIYADNECAMTEEFISKTEEIFAMAPENLDFTSSKTAKTISDEVKRMTNGNFENYLKPKISATLDHLIMIDAESFQGKWEKQFNPSETTLKDFYWSGRISKVQCMYQKDTFLYLESSALSAKVLRMNYVGGMFGLVIFLPNSFTGLNDLLKKLQNTNAVYSAVSSLTMQMVEIDLPKFEISVANRLKKPSEKAGVTRIFSNTSLGLESVASCEIPYVSEILQKITFHVDEYGMGETWDVVYDCAKNETLDYCVSDCPPRYCGVNIAAVLCAPIEECDCKKGCRCKDHYLRNGDGFCVHEKDCPKCHGLNEEYDVCPNPCPPQKCDVDPNTIDCPDPPQPGDKRCIPGCRCFEGYARNASGVCVPRDECPPSCGENEIYYDGTTDICRPLDCSQVGFTEPCTDSVEAGCICDYGYVWDSEGNCIPMTDCPSCGGDSNAISGCGTNCGQHCYDYYNHTVPCKEICYENACDCRKGYYYDDKQGKCVKPEKCTSKCPTNETLDSCISDCPPRYCGVNIAAVSCAAIPECDCEEGCRCKDGYLRNAEGFCIREEDCPKCHGKNEVYDVCPNPCPPQRCDVDPRVIRCATPPKPGDDSCKPGCRCIDGHARNADGECIPREKCPGWCGENEVYHDGTSQVCQPMDCSEVGYPTSCSDVEPGCICDFGYVRNSDGICIPMRDCESCGGDPNAWSGCGVNCGKRCSDLFNITRPCLKICYPNSCDCKDGFYYDENQKMCVPPEKCTKPCGKDEVFSNCANDDCSPKNCSQLGFPMPCLESDSTHCTKGCICQEGFVRADNGTCIQIKDCLSCNGDHNAEPGCDQDCSERCPGPEPDECVCNKDSCKCKDGYVYDPKTKKCVRLESCKPPCGKHEVLSNCSNGGCGPWTCDDVGFPTGCVKMDQKYCKVGCVCEEGYVRQNGTCIPATECPSCGGDPNAESGCGGNCGRLCSNYKEQNVSCTTECQKNACDCKKGFVYDEEQGKCVHPKNCIKKCQGPHEYFSCGGACDNVCETIHEQNQTHCPIINIQCNRMCYCEKGYARDKNNTCIPIKDCPPTSCGGDPNAKAGCGVNCGKLCPNQYSKPVPCPRICYPNACDCKEGFVYDKNIKQCVKPEDCKDIFKKSLPTSLFQHHFVETMKSFRSAPMVDVVTETVPNWDNRYAVLK